MLKSILKNKNVFIFDLDGTLIDSLNIWSTVDAMIIKEMTGASVDLCHLSLEREQFLAECKSKSPYQDYVVFLIERYQLDCNKDDLIEYRKGVTFKMLESLKLKPFAYELLTLLKSMGKTLCIATTGPKSSVDRILGKIEGTKIIGSLFDIVIMQNDVINLKPAPDAHFKIKDMLGMADADAIVIEDSIVGINAAKRANLDYIVVREDYHSNQDEIRNSAPIYVESLEEIYNSMLEIANNKPKLRELS
ncbi:MAG: HAD family phosphatase [Erysipelotrichales bacterium]|nr:HAD family phosphatase [Erysipelotrichales bacterium]